MRAVHHPSANQQINVSYRWETVAAKEKNLAYHLKFPWYMKATPKQYHEKRGVDLSGLTLYLVAPRFDILTITNHRNQKGCVTL